MLATKPRMTELTSYACWFCRRMRTGIVGGLSHVYLDTPIVDPETLDSGPWEVCTVCRPRLAAVSEGAFERECQAIRMRTERELGELSAEVEEREADRRKLESEIRAPIAGAFRRLSGGRAALDRAIRDEIDAKGRLSYCEREIRLFTEARRSLLEGRRAFGQKENRRRERAAVVEERTRRREQRARNKLDESTSDFPIARERLIVKKRSYNRGNAVDNHVRSHWFERLVRLQDGRCFTCERTEHLELDHLWLPKNAGGNFFMCLAQETLLIGNVVVLCRQCNAVKSDIDFSEHFSAEEKGKLADHCRLVSKLAMADGEAVRVGAAFYGVDVVSFAGD